MRKRLSAAFALLALAAGIGAGAATSTINCVWTRTDSSLAFDAGLDQFVMSYTGNCSNNGGYVGCCLKFSTDLLYSQTGTFYSQKSHQESQNRGNFCGATNVGDVYGVECPTSPAGFYKLSVKLLDCDGVTIRANYGSLVHQVH